MAETPTLEDTMATDLSTDVREVTASNPMAMLASIGVLFRSTWITIDSGIGESLVGKV